MTATRSITARAKLVAAVTALLIVLGAGSAAAYWTASAQLDGTAKAAQPKLSQIDTLSGLAKEYTAGALTTAGTTVIRNDSTAPARSYTLTVDAPSSTRLSAALTVSISEVDDAAKCRPDAILPALAKGRLPLKLVAQRNFPGEGSSVILCVQTSLPANDVFLYGGERAGITVISSLSYAAGDKWTARPGGSVGATIPQSVATSPIDDRTRMTCHRESIGIWATANFSKGGSLSGVTLHPYLIIDGQKVDLASSKAKIDTKNQRVDVKIAREDLVAGSIFDRPGKYWLVVEQRDAGGNVTIFGTGQLRYDLVTGIHCGW